MARVDEGLMQRPAPPAPRSFDVSEHLRTIGWQIVAWSPVIVLVVLSSNRISRSLQREGRLG